MENKFSNSRRTLVKSSIFGLIAVSIPSVLYSKEGVLQTKDNSKSIDQESLHNTYPAIDPQIALDVVGKSHFDLEGLKKIVDNRPELARSAWDWRFGDWESAIGAASHVGRRDIIEYLISKGARPDIFTFTTLGVYQTVKSIIEYSPGIQKTLGPHGTSLLDHAHASLRMKNKMAQKNIDDSNRLIDYLESLGNADGEKYQKVKEEDKEQYLGDYKYGSGEKEGFTISINMRKMISISEIGGFGGSLFKIAENKFIYGGTPSVQVSFQFKNEKVTSLTIKEPNFTLKANKI